MADIAKPTAKSPNLEQEPTNTDAQGKNDATQMELPAKELTVDKPSIPKKEVRERKEGLGSSVSFGPSVSRRGDLVVVSKSYLQALVKQVSQIRDVLPRVITQSNNFKTQLKGVQQVQHELEALQQSLETQAAETCHWKSRYDGLVTQLDTDRQEKFALKCEVSELTSQVNQQSEYCSSMGAACGTLLWRVSRCEDSIQSILVGSKVDEFLQLVGSTLETYSNTYSGDVPKDDTQETQFILSLCGVITNIAASPYGREFLMTHDHGRTLVDTFIDILTHTPSKQSAKMKNLMLMALYNISINQKGLKHFSSKPNMIPLLIWILTEEEDCEVKLHALRLIQSLVYDEHNVASVHQLRETLPSGLLQQLSCDKMAALREAAVELANDLTLLHSET